MIRFLLTIFVLYVAIRIVRQVLFPAPRASAPRMGHSGSRTNRLDQIEDAEFTEVDSK
jgi:hypothetical protein